MNSVLLTNIILSRILHLETFIIEKSYEVSPLKVLMRIAVNGNTLRNLLKALFNIKLDISDKSDYYYPVTNTFKKRFNIV